MVKVQETVSPVDGSLYVTRPLADDSEVDAALAGAAAARAGWRATPVAERIEICRAAAAQMVERAAELGEALTWQMGRPIAQSPKEITGGFAERASYMLDIAAGALTDIDVGEKEGFRRFIRREPVGTVLVLAPWNYPYLCSVNTVIPALAAGNAVVLKMAAQTPLVAEHYADAFAAAGLPEGVFQFLHADHATVARMIADPRVDLVAFTGSVGGGHAVVQAASERFIGMGLELGGKDPAYVRPDAPVAATAASLVDGAFFNAGQSCCAVERIYVHRDIYHELVDAFVAETEKLRVGDPTDLSTTMGPLVRPSAAQAVRAQVADAQLRGGRPLLDPERFVATHGAYLGPQVVVGGAQTNEHIKEEKF